MDCVTKICPCLVVSVSRTICSTSTSKIAFNEHCERISVDYDILNFNEGYKEVGVLVWLSLQKFYIYNL